MSASLTVRPNAASPLSMALLQLLSRVPRSDEVVADDPRSRARRLGREAARKAAAASAAMALPSGPLGMITVVPDLMTIWHIQRQLVADIAAVFGKSGGLTRESMLFCLFKHGSAALLRDLVVRVGERTIVKRASVRFLEELLAKLGVRVSQRALGHAISRWVPALGALGVGVYAHYDTSQVADNAIELFGGDVEPE
jgi:hypothetical protein